MRELLIGRWKADRIIRHWDWGADCFFTGSAEIAIDSFEETGELSIGSTTVSSRRFYRLQDRAKNNEIRFPDGRFFINLDDTPLQQVHHRCGEDDYRGRFIFKRDAWTERWDVIGPRKRYRSVTKFSRI